MYLLWTRPSATRRDRVLRIALPLLGIIGVNGVIAALAFAPGQSWLLILLIPIVTVIQVLTFALLRKERRRAVAIVQAANFQICPRCRYSLKGLEEQGDCPECGTHYTAASLRTEWADAYEITALNTPSKPSSPTLHASAISPTPPPDASKG